MINLGGSLTKENRNYIILPVLKDFCSKHHIKCDVQNRADLLRIIEDYANENNKNENEVLTFLDECYKEGTKILKIKKIDKESEISEEYINNRICKVYNDYGNSFIMKSTPQKDLTLINYSTEVEEGVVKKIEFTFTIQILTGNYLKEDEGEVVLYPVFVDLDMQNGFIIGRAKPTTLVFDFDGHSLKFDISKKHGYIEYIDLAIEKVKLLLEIEEEDRSKAMIGFKRAVFYLLESFSFTPEEIEKKMKLFEGKIGDILQEFEETYDIYLSDKLKNSARYDLNIFIEKFLSITYPDKDIFIKDRKAYPYRISVMDHEFVTVDETAGLRAPIQKKEAFFDNKKAIFYNKRCDKVHLCFKRINDKYFGKQPFRAIVEAKQEYCLINFPEYVREEDIQDVLSRITEHYIV